MTIGIPYDYQGFGQNQEPLSYRVVENYKPKSHNAPDTYIGYSISRVHNATHPIKGDWTDHP